MLALVAGVFGYLVVVHVMLFLAMMLAAALSTGGPDFKFVFFLNFISGAIAILAAGKLSFAIWPAFNRTALAGLSLGAHVLIALLAFSVLPRMTPDDFGNVLLTFLGTGIGVCTIFPQFPVK
jgi:hypothetical protein